MHSEYDSVESIADSEFEDGELPKCWLHHCICRIEKTMNPLESQSQPAVLLHERGSKRANRGQAD